ncbi:terpene synthase [Astrocystis sublimbata]|nr:terpene synthase [Astrocystis sublimbata]
MKFQDIPSTDRRRWHLLSDNGDHNWVYVDEPAADVGRQSDAEQYLLGFPLNHQDQQGDDVSTATTSPPFALAARKGFRFLTRVQLPEGHWACEYGGPSFLLPGLIFAMYISNMQIPREWGIEMTRYLAEHQNADGGWGLHLEGNSTVFATSLYYVVIAKSARACLLSLGGAIGCPQWGKIWLACLNLYGWEGVNCIPVDLWLLPSWLPFHPSRWWVQCRVVYLPTSYLWSNRCSTSLTPILCELRDEIYTEPFDTIAFHRYRNHTAKTDAIRKVSPLLAFLFAILSFWCYILRPSWLLRKANDTVSQLMMQEERNTNFNCLAPVNKAFHMVVATFEDGLGSPRLLRHQQRVSTYLWMGPNGMTCNGTNGVQVWDTAFAIQAAVGAGLAEDPSFQPSLDKALQVLDKSQLRDNLNNAFLQPRKGGWPFSTLSNGYIVSDCAAESMKAVLQLQNLPTYPCHIDQVRLQDCVDTLLLMQNHDGGFASYENIRGSKYLELLNPAEVFDDIMVERSYPECTTAVLTSLALFHGSFPEYRRHDIEKAIKKATRFVHGSQLPDGSWYGSWAICYTYGTFFALQALENSEEQYHNSDSVRKTCRFLLDRQMEDGGWGEHHSSCLEKRYVQHNTSQVVNTAWAALALMHAGYPDPRPIQRALQLISDRQRPNGDWSQEALEGIFNGTCLIGYPNYKLYFPVLALGTYSHMYLAKISS